MAKAPNVEKSVTPELWETPAGWERLKPLFGGAMQQPPEQRARYIDEVCGDDLELRDALFRLLRANEESISKGDGPIVDFHSLFSSAKPAFTAGELVSSQFRIVRLIGSGGMGEVYEAIDLELGHRIALKTIRPDIASNPRTLAHFKKEVLLAQRISGPHVCRIHAFHPPTDSAGRTAFLTMEFLEGMTLEDKIRESGALPWREVKAIALEICEGLRVMHEAGIIHRDLKSRNVMLANRNGTVSAVVMDFGLAHEVTSSTSETATDASADHGVAGTIDYMAPEQFAGDPLTPAADIFALGVVMYELSTGRHPFPSGTILQAAIRRGQRAPAPSSIQKGLPHRCDEIIGRCLEFDPKKRYRSASKVAEALKSSPVSVSRLREEIAPVPRRRLVGMAVLIVVVIGSGIGYIVYRSSRYHPPPLDAKTWYDRGLAALREGTYLQAIGDLRMAVQHYKKYLLAHARLAEAWQELDYTGPAQKEMLSASVPDDEGTLPDLDREYIEAVRTTLTQDFPGAVERYKDILHNLPDDQRAYGYLDLGRAYEKIGDLKDAVQSYEHAASLTPENPAPFVHLGILKSRQMDKEGGEAAFQKADLLYAAESNWEGRAEVAYQRGYAANVRGDSAQARSFLETSRQIARDNGNFQLQVRTLAQMSGAEDDAGNDDKAIDRANEEIQLARENEIEYWATDGLNRLGTAYFGKEDFADAERSFQQARSLANKNQHPKLEANAEFGLASIRDQQGRWDESIPLAREALKYYESFAFMSLAAGASELIIRGEEGKGDTTQALQSANESLQIARRWNDPASIEIAEESVGRILLGLEKFPDALTHFEEALKASRLISLNVAYQEVHCADVLWRLGRYSEAEEMLESIPAPSAARSDIASSSETIHAQMRLSQRRYPEALSLSRHALASFRDMPARQIAELERVATMSEAELGQIRQAQRDAQQLLSLARQQSDEELVAEASMALAAVDLQAHVPDQALQMAEAADRYFSRKGQKESEWLSLYYVAKACKASGNTADSLASAKKSLDIVTGFEQTWSPPTFHLYATRPDHQVILLELAKLRSA
jgi:serine/threonine protein kinase